jgi:opacity protein-like surface antigen
MPDDRAQTAALRAAGMERARLMRWVLGAVVVLALAPRAYAQDFGILRGTQPTYHWGGFYGGAQLGYSTADVNFSTATSDNVGFILRNTSINADEGLSQWAVLPNTRSSGSVDMGGFIGYNSEWENLIFGVELNYNRTSLKTSTASSEERTFVDSNNLPAGHHYFYDATVSAAASVQMTDIGEFRVRAGYELSNFLPYGFAGLAVGRVNYSNAASVKYTAEDFVDNETPPLTPLPDLNFGPVSQGQTQSNAFAYGFATGLGTEVGLTPNIFLRGELEYTYFFPFDGLHITVASARIGAGLKF